MTSTNDARKIAAKLEDCLEDGYFDRAILSIYALINHALFLEKQVASLKDVIARIQSEERKGEEGRGDE